MSEQSEEIVRLGKRKRHQVKDESDGDVEEPKAIKETPDLDDAKTQHDNTKLAAQSTAGAVSQSLANTTKGAVSLASAGKQSLMQDEDEINSNKEKTPDRENDRSNEARSAPNKPSGIAAFILPDSMADIFGDDYKPIEIKKPEPKIQKKQVSPEKKKEEEIVTMTPDKPLTQSPEKEIVQETPQKIEIEVTEPPIMKESADPASQKSAGIVQESDKKPEAESEAADPNTQKSHQSESKQMQVDNQQQQDAKSEKSSSSGSSSSFSSQESNEQNALKEKLAKIRALLKQKKMDQVQHKKALVKEANNEKRRQEKQKLKEQHALEKSERMKRQQQEASERKQKAIEDKKKEVLKKFAEPKPKKQPLPVKPREQSERNDRPKVQKYTQPTHQQSAPTTDEELDFTNKLHCVDEFAKRWWYAMPEWPPADFDYDAALKQRNFREVELASFKAANEVKGGLKKVYPNEYYQGIYTDSAGRVYDLRPQEQMPSLANFQRMDMDKLRRLLKTAYEKQKEALDKAKADVRQYDKQTEDQIEHSLAKKIGKITRYM